MNLLNCAWTWKVQTKKTEHAVGNASPRTSVFVPGNLIWSHGPYDPCARPRTVFLRSLHRDNLDGIPCWYHLVATIWMRSLCWETFLEIIWLRSFGLSIWSGMFWLRSFGWDCLFEITRGWAWKLLSCAWNYWTVHELEKCKQNWPCCW